MLHNYKELKDKPGRRYASPREGTAQSPRRTRNDYQLRAEEALRRQT